MLSANTLAAPAISSSNASVCAPVIDYHRHPAFAQFTQIAAQEDVAVSRCVAHIDCIYDAFKARALSMDAVALKDYQRRFNPTKPSCWVWYTLSRYAAPIPWLG